LLLRVLDALAEISIMKPRKPDAIYAILNEASLGEPWVGFLISVLERSQTFFD
jgi:hypothetical protein